MRFCKNALIKKFGSIQIYLFVCLLVLLWWASSRHLSLPSTNLITLKNVAPVKLEEVDLEKEVVSSLQLKSSVYNITYFGAAFNQTSYATVVCSMFRFGKSKHSVKSYEDWTDNMMKSVSGPIVAFVDFYWADKFIEKSKLYNRSGVLMATNSIWRIMSDLEDIRGRDYHNRYVQMVAQDAEKRLHSPELYAIWNLKTYMMVVASIMNPFRSEFFIYTDTGAWRHRNLSDWPDQSFLRLLAQHLDNRVLYAQVRDPSKDNFSPRLNFVEGGFFAGSARAIRSIYQKYYDLHDAWMDRGEFVGKDQAIMNEMAFRGSNKNSIVRLRTTNLKCSTRYNRWFFYQYYLARSNEFICTENRLKILL